MPSVLSPSDATPFISMDDVSFRLYDRILFEHTHWEILNDQHWAVIGANGSGKSTLMKALCGQVPVIKGKIIYHFLKDDASSNGLGIGFLPQNHIAHVSFDAQQTALERESPFHQARWNVGVSEERLSVSEYLSENYVKKINPHQVLEERADPAAFMAQRSQVVELLEISELLEKDIIQLSNGERRKILIARALINAPRLLILDNPFTGLDQGFRAKLAQIVKRLMQDEMRVVVATTRRDEIPLSVTHVLVVEGCKVVAQGSKKAILNHSSIRRITDFDQPADLQLRLAQRRQPGKKEVESPILVRMDNVNVSYGGAKILSQVNWTVQKGENWALLGANGAGKTTLLSLILGDNPQAYANNVTLFGRRRGSGESIWEIKRYIGWVSSELHLYYPRNVSCFDVVCSGFFDSIGLYHRCSSRQRKAAKLWMQYLGMTRYADMAFARISQGEQRMILIARALVKRPLLLVLDEPCQGLDAGHRDQVLQIVDAVGRHLDTNIIYVTHDSDTLPRIITHVIRLNRGRIVQNARIDESKEKAYR